MTTFTTKRATIEVSVKVGTVGANCFEEVPEVTLGWKREIARSHNAHDFTRDLCERIKATVEAFVAEQREAGR